MNDWIMMFRRSFLAGVVLGSTLCSTAAVAGPPDMVDVHDEFFGAAQGEIFVLRNVTDNMGSHTNAVGTVFLVAIDTATSAETLWPLHRARLQPANRSDAEIGAVDVLTEVLGGARNPFDILAERRAMPSGSAAFFVSPGSDTLTLTAQGIAFEHNDGRRYAMSAEALIAGLGDLTASLSQKMEPYGRPGMLGIRDLLETPDLSITDCSTDQPSLLRFPVEMPSVPFTRLTCGELENGMRISVLRVIPPEHQP